MDKIGYIYSLDKPIVKEKLIQIVGLKMNRSCILVNPPILTKRAILNF